MIVHKCPMDMFFCLTVLQNFAFNKITSIIVFLFSYIVKKKTILFIKHIPNHANQKIINVPWTCFSCKRGMLIAIFLL